jgi:hypothetical protein
LTDDFDTDDFYGEIRDNPELDMSGMGQLRRAWQ